MSAPKISKKALSALKAINREWQLNELKRTKSGRVTDLTVAKYCANAIQSYYQSAVFCDFVKAGHPNEPECATTHVAKVEAIAAEVSALGFAKQAQMGLDYGKCYDSKGPKCYPRQWVSRLDVRLWNDML